MTGNSQHSSVHSHVLLEESGASNVDWIRNDANDSLLVRLTWGDGYSVGIKVTHMQMASLSENQLFVYIHDSLKAKVKRDCRVWGKDDGLSRGKLDWAWVVMRQVHLMAEYFKGVSGMLLPLTVGTEGDEYPADPPVNVSTAKTMAFVVTQKERIPLWVTGDKAVDGMMRRELQRDAETTNYILGFNRSIQVDRVVVYSWSSHFTSIEHICSFECQRPLSGLDMLYVDMDGLELTAGTVLHKKTIPEDSTLTLLLQEMTTKALRKAGLHPHDTRRDMILV